MRSMTGQVQGPLFWSKIPKKERSLLRQNPKYLHLWYAVFMTIYISRPTVRVAYQLRKKVFEFLNNGNTVSRKLTKGYIFLNDGNRIIPWDMNKSFKVYFPQIAAHIPLLEQWETMRNNLLLGKTKLYIRNMKICTNTSISR